MNNVKRAIMVMEQYRRVARIAGDEKSVSEITYLIDNVDRFEAAVNELCMKGFINNTTARVINHVEVYLGGHKYV